MIPVLSPSDVKTIDERATEHEDLDAIVERAGAAVAREALAMLGGSYGRRVIVLAGPGLNGADARSAARLLEARGVRVRSIELDDMPESVSGADLVIDGVFGIGLNRPWEAPRIDGEVLSIDVPSGIDGVTGESLGTPVRADVTVTFGGYKQGLLFGDGPECAGEVRVADIGLPGEPATAHLVESDDVRDWFPERDRESHKWHSALLVVAGSPGMTGAAVLSSSAAMRTGAGYVHLDTAASTVPGLAVEVVSSLAGSGVQADNSRFNAAVVGPGLSRTSAAGHLVRAAVGALSDVPVVIDGDGISAIADHEDLLLERSARASAVLTPHDGEFERLAGKRPQADRVAAATELAALRHAVVLLKGPTTVVADPDGSARVITTGDARLATAGTGDVLSGIIGALLARGVAPFDAAAAGTFIHGAAAQKGRRLGLVASDVVDQIPATIESIVHDAGGR